MAIEFLNMLAEEGWEPAVVDPTAPGARWSEGGTLADAPVDVAATFGQGRRCSTELDPEFGLTGIRLEPGFVIPRHHHNQPVLRIVFGGSFEVASDDETASVDAGQFCVVDTDTAHSITAGPDGVTFTESWMLEAPEVQTTWHPDPAWVNA